VVDHIGLIAIAAAKALPSTSVPDANAAPTSALGTLLTTESLLFAALSVSVALAADTEWGRRLPTSPFVFACSVVALLTLVACGAGAAWSSDYVSPGPDGLAQWAQAVALAAGIVGQPIFALWVALGLRD
jgi:hypothetical protein